jgi:para-aminobenzoate synthetase component 1
LADFHTNIGRDDYIRAIERIKRYIRDGEVYQVNLSQRFEHAFEGRPIDLFHWQNRYNPSPYAAYLDAGGHQIVSASPEMFIDIRDGRIQTKPIKGTRPRLEGDDPDSRETNARHLRELLNSPKEQAELNMIVDLQRNDLSRICTPGTRTVTQPRTIETHPTVFHAVATIAGQLRPDVGFTDVLQAVFPGGSITGAPKIRAMEIIDEMEPTARGVYTGSIGFIGLDGTACLNIAIRTVIITARKAFVQAGGGIVADSDPQAEWQETVTKARALLAGIEAVCLRKSS